MTDAAPHPRAGLVQTLSRVAPAMFIIQVVGFGSSVVLARMLGATTSTDAYYLALTVPLFGYGVLLAGVRQGAIPTLTAIAQREGPQRFAATCRELVSGSAALAMLFSIVITGAMMVSLPVVAGGSHHLVALTRLYVVELAPYAVSGATLGALGAILAVRGRFAVPALVLGCEPLMKAGLVLGLPQIGAQALVLGSLGGNLLAVTILWRLVRRDGLSLRFVQFRSSPVVRGMFRVIGPLLIAQTVLQFNPLIDRVMAAGLQSGNVTALELGVRLSAAPASLLAAILIAPLSATWSARLSAEGWNAVCESFARVTAAILIIVPPLAVAVFYVRRDLVALFYQSHAYTAIAVSRTADVFGLLLLGIAAQALVVAVSTLFVVRGNTIFPMKIAIANAVLNALLDLVLRGPFGVAGIAFSTTLTMTVLCAVYFWEAHRVWGSLYLRTALRPAVVCAVSCFAIAASSTVLIGAGTMRASRGEQLFGIALGLGTAVLIQGSLIVAAGLSRHVGGPSISARNVCPSWLTAPFTRRRFGEGDGAR